MNAVEAVTSPGKPLWNRNFALLLSGQWMSQIGNAVYNMALPIYVYRETGSAAYTGIVMAVAYIPFTFLGPFAGSIADRWDRKKIMLAADGLSGLLMLTLATMAWVGSLSLPILLVSAGLGSVLSAFFFPAIMSSVPNLVERAYLVRAMSLMDVARNTSSVIGPALGSGLVLLLGFPLCFLINALSFFAGATTTLLLSLPYKPRGLQARIWQDLKEGFTYIVQRRLLLGLTLLVLVLNFVEPAILPVIMPKVAHSLLAIGDAGYGLIRTLYGIGGVAALLALALIPPKARKSPLLVVAICSIGATLLVMAIALGWTSLRSAQITVLTMVLLYGFTAGVGNTVVMVLYQMLIPDSLRGRAFGLISTLAAASIPFSFYGLGTAAEVFTVPPVLLFSGIALALGGVVMLFLPGFREL